MTMGLDGDRHAGFVMFRKRIAFAGHPRAALTCVGTASYPAPWLIGMILADPSGVVTDGTAAIDGPDIGHIA